MSSPRSSPFFNPWAFLPSVSPQAAAVGKTKHLQPTVSLQYHFDSASPLDPCVGAGLNYTLFFDEETAGPLTGAALDLDGSFGLAAQIGFDYDISDGMYLNVDARWIDIDTDAKLDGAALETVEIDPLVNSLTAGSDRSSPIRNARFRVTEVSR
jgi:outer membrane protein W